MSADTFYLFLQAIFELSQGEEDLIEDLKLAKKVNLSLVIIGVTSYFFLLSNFIILRLCFISTPFYNLDRSSKIEKNVHKPSSGGK